VAIDELKGLDRARNLHAINQCRYDLAVFGLTLPAYHNPVAVYDPPAPIIESPTT
jgi:hypothetical protein